MKRQKLIRNLTFIALAFVIIASVALPAILASYGEKKLLSDTNLFDNGVSAPEPSEDVRAKLLLITDHAMGTRPVTLTEQKNIIASGGENAVLSAAVAELKKLSDFGLLPAVSPSAPAENTVCSAATYLDPENISSRVTVWKLSFSADGYDITLWMDARTHTVFCAAFTNTAFSLSDAKAQSIASYWGSYIGLDEGTVTVSGDGFSADYSGVSFDFFSDGQTLFIRLSNADFNP